MADILPLLDNDGFRRSAIAPLENEQVRRFWCEEYAHYPLRYRAEVLAPIQNKVGAFSADPVLKRILTVPSETFDFEV